MKNPQASEFPKRAPAAAAPAFRYFPGERGLILYFTILLVSVALVRALAEAWFYRANFGFTVSFGDDVMRALTANVWVRAPNFRPSVTLPPLEFYLLGAVIKATGNVVLGSLVLQNAVCGASLLAIWLIACELFPGNFFAAAIAVATAALHPAHLLYSMGSMQIPYLDCSVLYAVFFLMRHMRTRLIRDLILSALLFLAATMVHYDGWLYAFLFWVFLLASDVDARPRSLALAVSAAFIPCWIAFQHYEHGSILYYVMNQSQLRHVYPLLTSIAGPFREFCVVFPAVLFFFAAALWSLKPRGDFASWRYLLFPLGEIVLMVPLHYIHVVNPYCHYTHLWTNFMLLAPWAGLGACVFLRPWKKTMTLAAIVLIGAFNASRFNSVALSMNNFSSGIIKTCAIVRDVSRPDLLSPADRVMAEVYVNDTEFQGRIWELPLLFFIRPPQVSPFNRAWDTPLPSDHFIFDRRYDYSGRASGIVISDKDNASALADSAGGLSRRLRRDRVAILIVHTDAAAKKAASVMQEAASAPPYRIFVPKEAGALKSALAASAAKVDPAHMPWRY